jgi:putative heme-binding domain-containing protein
MGIKIKIKMNFQLSAGSVGAESGSSMTRFCSVTVLWLLAGLPSYAQTNPAKANELGKSKSEYRHFALIHEGDVARGKARFNDEERLACVRCHSLEGKPAKAGPDLYAVGDKFARRDLIESVVAPSATIAVGYSTTIFDLKDGEQVEGIVKNINDAAVDLVSGDGKQVRIRESEIENQRISSVSLMPEGLEAGLTLQEFTDLIEYLQSLKAPASENLLRHGMPAEIPMLATPVPLEPFITESNKFSHPVWFGEMPGGTNKFIVLEHETGRIWLLHRSAREEEKTLFLDLGANIISGGTRGLLGFCFHPGFAQNHRYFITLHVVENGQIFSKTIERLASAEFLTDAGSAREILRIKAATGVHYGGSLAFGPDGMLYIGMGDTGPQEDPQGNGQNLSLLRGKIMRIDVEHPSGTNAYSIPMDNPFVNQAAVRPEIWAYGLREPWRISFDPINGQLWVGDVGQDRYEEVDIVRRGQNYGWNVYEGFEKFSDQYRRPKENYVYPVFAYARKYGPSVTGGFVYRADPRSSFYGAYIFADYESRRIFALTEKAGKLEEIRQIATAPQRVVSFGKDGKGEIYVVGYEGMIYRMDLGREAE